jgi:hypothetical protein
MHALFLSNTRMYELTWRDGAGPDLPVEAWWGREALSAGFELCIDLLATDAHLELKRFLGRAVRLATRLSDGGQAHRSGLVRAAQKLGADGGFARYRLTVVPWVWLLGRGRHNRVFQDKTVVQILESVLPTMPMLLPGNGATKLPVFSPTPVREATACNTVNPTMPSFRGYSPKKVLAGVSRKIPKPRPATACASLPIASSSGRPRLAIGQRWAGYPLSSCRLAGRSGQCARLRATKAADQ